MTAAAPVISGTAQYPATATSAAPVVITTTATDSGVTLTAVNLVYNTGSGAATVAMTSLGSGAYTADIPAQSAGTTVRYYISATNSGSETTTDPGTPCSRSATCIPTRSASRA